MRISCVGGTAVWRRGMRSILDDGGYEAVELEALNDWAPGFGGVAAVVLLDSDEDGSGLQEFGETFPHIPLVAVLPDLGLTALADAIRAGAVAVVDDADPPERVLEVLRSALDGYSLLPIRLTRAMAELVPSDSEASKLLNPEEIEWLRAMSRGETVYELSERVGYSERAMFRHLKKVYLRVGARNRTEALIWATENRLL